MGRLGRGRLGRGTRGRGGRRPQQRVEVTADEVEGEGQPVHGLGPGRADPAVFEITDGPDAHRGADGQLVLAQPQPDPMPAQQLTEFQGASYPRCRSFCR
jgi:hypothetical protein